MHTYQTAGFHLEAESIGGAETKWHVLINGIK